MRSSYRVGQWHAPPQRCWRLAAARYSSAQQADPVSTDSVSIEDVLTPEDEAELEDLHDDDADPEDAEAGVRGVG